MALDKLTQITSTGINSTTPLNGISVSGIVTGGAATFDSVDVLGVLTYDDVTNIDALGIVTARSGIHVTGGDVGIGTDNPGAKLHVQGTGTEIWLRDSDSKTLALQTTSTTQYIKAIDIGTGGLPLEFYASQYHFGTGNVGFGTNNPGSLLHALGSYGTVRVENDNTAQYAASGIELKGPAGDERSTKIIHGNSNAGGTETYFQIEQYNAAGSYVKTLSQYNYQYDYWAFNTGGTQRLQITSDGSTYTGGSTITESDMNWTHNAYQRPHIFTGATGGNPSDGAIVIASPETDPSATRVGSVIYGCKTSSTTGVSNSGIKAVIDSYTNTNVSDAWKTGADLRFGTRPDNGNVLERLRITSEGEVLIGTTAANSFNGVGLKNNLIVAGSTSDTDITDNSSAAITISNKDGTAGNTAGLHFAREDTDGTPHYAGASIVTQFLDTQVTGQYPRSELAFLTSTAANNAPSEKMRIYASGAVTTPSNPLLKLNSTATYGAYQSLHVSPNVSIAQATAQINVGDTNFATSGANAYTFVCPVTGVYALHAHITLGGPNVNQNRVIWSMAYTLGGGNLPLQNYVEVIDTHTWDYQNASYFDTWYFTAGTRIGMGINSNSGGSIADHGFYWGAYLLQ